MRKVTTLFLLLLIGISTNSKSDVTDKKEPFLTTAPFEKNLICLPDPYVVLEQVLRWEIEYLRSLDAQTFPIAEKLLLKKHDELSKMEKDCLQKYNKQR